MRQFAARRLWRSGAEAQRSAAPESFRKARRTAQSTQSPLAPPLPPMSPADNPEILAAAAPKAKSARARLQELRRGPPLNSSAAPPAKARPVPQHLPAAVSVLSARRSPRRAKTAGLTAPSPQPARDNLPSPAHDCVRAALGEIRRP